METADRRETIVLDTSVLLADPRALSGFPGQQVVLPWAVVQELEAKRNHLDLGYFARQVLRFLEELRVKHVDLKQPVPLANGGTLRIEVNHLEDCPFPITNNDSRILAVAFNLNRVGEVVTLVSNDLPLRIAAGIHGITAVEYRAALADDHDGWNGLIRADVSDQCLARVYEGTCVLKPNSGIPIHAGILMRTPSGAEVLTRLDPDGVIRAVVYEELYPGVKLDSPEEQLAAAFLSSSNIKVISMGGRAGTGKSALALLAAFRAVRGSGSSIRDIVVFRPVNAVGDQNIGFLPGSIDDKMAPLVQAVKDTLAPLLSPGDLTHAMQIIQVRPMAYVRGTTLSNSVVIVDEAQNLDYGVLLAMLSRMGKGSICVLTHDIAQRDNLRVGRHDGIVRAIEKMKGHPLFAHVTLTRSVRSPVADMATSLLEADGQIMPQLAPNLTELAGGLESLLV